LHVYGLAVVWRQRLDRAGRLGSPTIFPGDGFFYINVPVGIVSLLLTNFLVSDPPYMKKANVKERDSGSTYIGIG